nr:outer membrane protein porin [Tanacetum cinerariifolium]
MSSMPSTNSVLVDLNEIENVFQKLFELLENNFKRESIFYTYPEELRLIDVCVQAKLILRNWHTYFELLKYRLLEASLAEDIKNLVITSCVEIRNKDLHDETERISKESKDVSSESKKDDTESGEKQNAFDKEERATFRKWNAFDKEICDFGSKVIHLEKIIAQKSKDLDDVDDSKAEKDQFLKEINHLRTQLENMKGKSVKTKFGKSSILEKPPAEKLLITSQLLKSWFNSKIVMKKDFSKSITAQSMPKNEKDQLLKRIASLEFKLASPDIHSCQKEYHELRTLYNALKVKFDSLNRKRRETNVSEKVHTGESLAPFSSRVSQFTTYSLQKDRKFSKNSQKVFKKRASNVKNHSFETSHSCFTPVKQVWKPIKES